MNKKMKDNGKEKKDAKTDRHKGQNLSKRMNFLLCAIPEAMTRTVQRKSGC